MATRRPAPTSCSSGGFEPGHLRLSDGEIHDLAYLRPRRVIPWAKLQAVRSATVPGYDAVIVGGLHLLVEGVAGLHVPESGGGRSVDGPAFGQHNYFAQLPPGHVVAWA